MDLDPVLGEANLYLGGLFTLKRKAALKRANITHVLSVLTLPLDEALFEGYQRLVIDIDDLEDQDIIQHFPTSNAFIKAGLEGGGGVLVHCAMGKSRSATLLIAHYLSTHPAATPTTALMLLRQGRPMAEPNPGFMDQLHLYHRMRCPTDDNGVAAHPLYQRWCYQREVKRSRAAAQAPGSEFIMFEDETPAPAEEDKPTWEFEGGKEVAGGKEEETEGEREEYRCRRCRTQLGDSTYRVPHTPRHPANSSSNGKKKKGGTSSATTTTTTTTTKIPPCAHLFLTPLSWMRPVLSQGNLDGRLECPNAKCGQNVGKYAWQGMQCSCGEWVVPGISVARGKVDVVAVGVRKGAAA